MSTFKPKTLKQVMEDVGVTAVDLHEKGTADRKMVGKYSSGKAIPRFDTALKLCADLGISPKSLALLLRLDVSDVPDDVTSSVGEDITQEEALTILAASMGYSVTPNPQDPDHDSDTGTTTDLE